MNIEDYKKIINVLIEDSKDLEYIIAMYTFAVTYPDKSRKAG